MGFAKTSTSDVRGRAAAAALGVIALLLAACGDDDGGTTAADPAEAGDDTVNAADGGDLGEILVDSDGNTLYLVDGATSGDVMCTDACLDMWPPLTVPSGDEPTAGEGVDGTLSTFTRDDGTVQVTYDGAPLYNFANDSGPGDISGHGVSDPITWHAVTPDGPAPLESDDGGGGPYGG